MNVLVFTNMYPFEEMPYYGSFVEDEVRALRRAGCEVDVLFINGLKSKSEYLRMPGRFSRHVRGSVYDIVHCHHSYCAFVAMMQRRIPIVWTFHEGEIAGGAKSASRDALIKRFAYSKRFKRIVARRVDAVITVADYLKKPLGREDAVTIPSGIDIGLFAPMDREEARRELGLSVDGRYVLFPSTPSRPEKGFELARRAVELASKRTGPVEILCLEDVPHERVPLYMNACDILLMTSSFEASPVTVREAIACNLPVVSTAVGDVQEVVSGIEGCHVVEADEEKVASAVESCLLAGARIEGRERAVEWSLERTASRIIDVYRTTLERRDAGSR